MSRNFHACRHEWNEFTGQFYKVDEGGYHPLISLSECTPKKSGQRPAAQASCASTSTPSTTASDISTSVSPTGTEGTTALSKSKKRYSKKVIIKQVQAIRKNSNILWMHLLEVAIENPKMKKVVRQIIANDKKIIRWMSRI
jgi:hypothetical protein